MRGQWVVCVRDVPAGEDAYVGPFTSEERAHAVARRLRRDFEAVGADDTVIDACVEWMRPSADIEEMRDELLRDLHDSGFIHPRERAEA